QNLSWAFGVALRFGLSCEASWTDAEPNRHGMSRKRVTFTGRLDEADVILDGSLSEVAETLAKVESGPNASPETKVFIASEALRALLLRCELVTPLNLTGDTQDSHVRTMFPLWILLLSVALGREQHEADPTTFKTYRKPEASRQRNDGANGTYSGELKIETYSWHGKTLKKTLQIQPEEMAQSFACLASLVFVAQGARDLMPFSRLQASLAVAADDVGLGWTVRAMVVPMTFGPTLLLGMDDRAARMNFQWPDNAKKATLWVPSALKEVGTTGGAQVVVDKVTGTMLADAKSNLTAKVFDTFNLNRSTFFMASTGANITVLTGFAGRAYVEVGEHCTVTLGCEVQEATVEAEGCGTNILLRVAHPGHQQDLDFPMPTCWNSGALRVIAEDACVAAARAVRALRFAGNRLEDNLPRAEKSPAAEEEWSLEEVEEEPADDRDRGAAHSTAAKSRAKRARSPEVAVRPRPKTPPRPPPGHRERERAERQELEQAEDEAEGPSQGQRGAMTSAHGGEGSPSMMAAEEPDDRSGRKFELRLNSEELFTEEFKEGDILEVLDLEGVAEDGILRGVFWVEAVELADRSGVTLRVACLGGDGKSETALLGTTFNRKKVRLHLCSGREKDTPCTVGATMAHAQTFYKYPLTDYPLKYVSEEVAKAYKRRRREWDRKRGKGGRDRSESPSRGRRGAGEENPPVRPSALRRKRKESEPPIGQEAERADPESHWRAPGGQGDEEAEEHGEPKERTSREGGHTTRTRQSSNAALSHALGNLRRRLGIEKAPEQRDGVGNGGERSGDFKAAEGALGRAKTRASREPIPVEPIEDEGEATKGTTMSSLKKVQTEKKDRVDLKPDARSSLEDEERGEEATRWRAQRRRYYAGLQAVLFILNQALSWYDLDMRLADWIEVVNISNVDYERLQATEELDTSITAIAPRGERPHEKRAETHAWASIGMMPLRSLREGWIADLKLAAQKIFQCCFLPREYPDFWENFQFPSNQATSETYSETCLNKNKIRGYAASNEMRRQLHHVQEISVTDHAFAALNGDGRIVTWGVPEFGGNSSSVQEELHHVQKIVATRGETVQIDEKPFTDVVAEHINVWVEENSTELHRDVALKAAEIYSNALGTEELKPTPDTQSWMEQECKAASRVYGRDDATCSQEGSCGFDNAFVMSSDYLVNYPAPVLRMKVNNKSNNNNDIIFYLCQELVDGNPNPYAVANTFAHELAHVIQGGCLVLNQGRNVLEPDVEAEPVTDAEVESLECVDVGVDFEQAWALSGLDAKRPRVTSKDVRDALQAHQLQVRCTNTQLHNFVVRFNRTGPPQSGKGNLTLSQVRNAAMDYMCESMEAWATWNPWRLVVLPCPTFEVDRICVVWTCPGMLRRAACLQGKVVKLAVDAKQKIVANEYGIVTVSFLVSSATPSKTWAGTKHTKSIDTHTATQEPFIQALVNSESEANNMTQIFTEACNLAERYCGLDLRAQVWQVHKDYAKGIEASRRKVFPYARPCDDYVHMRRASYKILQKYLPTKTQRTSKDKAKKRASPSPARASTMAAKEEEDFSQLERVIQISREVPTVQMFDAIWQLAFPWLREKSAAAAEYLQRTYFQQVPTESLQKGFRCNATLWGADSLWFGGFWGGILGTYPGSSSGTQPLESFHSYWQGTIKAKARTSPADRFGSMQDLFQKDWAARFAWDEEKKFVTWPARSADALFNSQSLRSAGRSPARDFWEHREKRLCGNRNYREVYIRTGDTEGAGMEGMTTFWVLQSRAHDKVTAAEAIVLPDVAETVANLIAAEGTQLEKWLAKGGIVREGRLELGALQKYMHRYCAVLEGHLVQVSWPRSHRKLKKAVPGKLCTCREFLLHADCEHVLFIKALQNDPTASMQNIPTLRPRGRKRKGFGSSSGVMMEGGATWLEGNLLNLAPRPMIYAWGFRDWSGGSVRVRRVVRKAGSKHGKSDIDDLWNRINAAHIYAQSKKTNARKRGSSVQPSPTVELGVLRRLGSTEGFYQIHAMLLTYLSQDMFRIGWEALLGDRGSSALQNYETFSEDYFLQFVGKDQPGAFDPLELEVNSVEHPFGEVLLNFRVALAAQCINEASKRPTEPRYWMPENLRDRPFWDCTSFPWLFFETNWTFGPTEGAAQHEGLELHYGGAGIYRPPVVKGASDDRLALAADATVQVDPSADWQLRTKVLAAGHAGGPAEVRELRPGETATLGLLLGEEKETEHEGVKSFQGEREIFVVQVNVDPEGETLSRADKDDRDERLESQGSVWNQDICEKLQPGCVGKAWTTSKNGFYPSLAAEGLRTPMLKLPEASGCVIGFR
ncbi:Ribosomal protein L15, partial [Durusdinium trenchii]